jgi:hypothetical protein
LLTDDKSFPTDQYGTTNRHRAYEKPASSSSRLLYDDLSGLGDIGFAHDVPVRHVAMVWEPTNGPRQVPSSYDLNSDLHDAYLDPGYGLATPATHQHKTKWQKGPSGGRKSSNLFNYDDVLAAYHHGTGKAAYPAESISPLGYNVSPAASITYDQAMSVYHSKNTVPYNRQDYKKYPYGYSGSGSGLSSMTFPQPSQASFDGASGQSMLLHHPSTVRGFSGSQSQPGPGSQPGGQFDYIDVSSSASAPVQGFLTKQHQQANPFNAPRNINSPGPGQLPHHPNSGRSRPTPGFSSFLPSPSSSTLDGSTGGGPLMSSHHLHHHDIGQEQQLSSRRSNTLNLLAPILRNYLMRGGASYERLDYDKEAAYRHAPFLAAFFS